LIHLVTVKNERQFYNPKVVRVLRGRVQREGGADKIDYINSKDDRGLGRRQAEDRAREQQSKNILGHGR